MNQDEKKLLEDIDNLRSKLLNGQWNGVYTMKPSGYSYRMNADQMLEKFSN